MAARPSFRPRTALALLCIGAFVLAMGTLAFFEIPEPNREMFAQALGALNLLIGGIAAYYWPRRDRPERTTDGAET